MDIFFNLYHSCKWYICHYLYKLREQNWSNNAKNTRFTENVYLQGYPATKDETS